MVNKSISEELNWIAEVMKYRDPEEASSLVDPDAEEQTEIEHGGDLDFPSREIDTYWPGNEKGDGHGAGEGMQEPEPPKSYVASHGGLRQDGRSAQDQ